MEINTNILASNPEYEALLIQQEKLGMDLDKSMKNTPEYITCKITLDINDITLFYEYPKDKSKTIIWVETGSFILDVPYSKILELYKESGREVKNV